MSNPPTLATKWYLRKGFLIPLVFGGVPFSYYLYDRYQCNLITQKYLSAAKLYGQVPLSPDQSSMKITFVADGVDRNDLINQYERFMKIAQPILTAAGLEFEWIESSRRKHAIEYVKYWNDTNNDNEQEEENNTPKENNSQLNIPSENSSIKLFSNITEWRIMEWLIRDMENSHSKSSIIIKSGSGFLNNIWSVISWPVNFFLPHKKEYLTNVSTNSFTDSSSLSQGHSVDKLNSASIATLSSSLSEDSINSTKIDTNDQIILEKVKKNLLPKEVNINAYRQGIIGVGEDVFIQMIDGIRMAALAGGDNFVKSFLGNPIRLGIFTLEKSYNKSFLERCWGFFNRRNEVSSCSELIFGVISESLDMWNADLDEKIWPAQSEKAKSIKLSYLPFFGTLLFFKPVAIDMNALPK